MLIYQYLQQQNSGHCSCCSGTGISSDQSLPSAVLYEGAPTIALPHPSSGDEPVNDPFAPLWMSRPKKAKKSAKRSSPTAGSSNADTSSAWNTPTPMDVSDSDGTPTAPSGQRKGSLGVSGSRFQPPHHHCCHPQGLSKSGGAAASGMMVVMEGEDMAGLTDGQPGSSSHQHNHYHGHHHPNCGRQYMHQHQVGMRLPYQQHYAMSSHHGTAGSGFRSVMAGGNF